MTDRLVNLRGQPLSCVFDCFYHYGRTGDSGFAGVTVFVDHGVMWFAAGFDDKSIFLHTLVDEEIVKLVPLSIVLFSCQQTLC